MALARSLLRPIAMLAVPVLVALGVAACGQGPAPDRPTAPALVAPSPEAATPAPARDELAGWTRVEEASRGDAAHGKKLVARYECSRCHAGTGEPAPSFDRQCVGCHKAIKAESLPFPREKLDAWSEATRHFITTPSLATVGQTVRASWLAAFLHEPVKVRPHEEEWMPRLAISDGDARDIAAFLTERAEAPREVAREGDVERGRVVVTRKGCFMCHAFTGAAASDVAMEVPQLAADKLQRGIAQAPDLRLARERFRPDALARWILDPARVRADAEMPTLGLTEEEAKDAAAYVLGAKLAPPEPAEPPLVRLPPLDRPVSFEEVASSVFRRSCTHCHAKPGPSGDAGPGSTGGFGFPARGVELLSWGGTQRGYIADDRIRRSLFVPEPALASWGGARLVAALVARHEETSGRPVEGVRGMPMGLPGLSAEQIQLVETWVTQGAKP
jgi:mono/diheme cytochrome c family protein